MGHLVLTLFLALAAPTVHADTDYVLEDVGEILIEYPAGAEGMAREAVRIYRESMPAVEAALGHPYRGAKIRISIAPSPSEFERIVKKASGGGAPPGRALAVALPASAQMVIKASSLETFTVNSLPFTVRHELSHIALAEIARGPTVTIPRWFDEGVAEYVSGKRLDAVQLGRLRSAALAGSLPTLRDLSREFPLEEWSGAYPQSHSFVRFVVGRFGQDALHGVIRRLSAGVAFEEGWEAEVGVPLDEVEQEWLEGLREDRSFLWAYLSERDPITIVFLCLAFLVIIGFLLMRVRRRRILRRMDAEEEAAR